MNHVRLIPLTALLPGVEGAVVKWARGFHSATTLTPEAARDVIYQPSLEP